ncbi:hypothetical protein J437_LFUL006019 [Ladona fulva]|uniref:Protein odr-4 homolog n=1 Tax=Ladona fulva TaxID=123851 RepID=A0A8K0JZ45_LADFU|nr:hypothetical protein J437_LFUL006019 [Ladona fulva]
MGRTIILEENLIPSITKFLSPNAYVIGLILGQSTGQKDYVVHLARTPRPAKEDIEEEVIEANPFGDKEKKSYEKPITSIKDLEENWVADHAKHVTRMLPGGMWVLGIFTGGPSDPFDDSGDRSRVRSALLQIRDHFMKHSYLHGDGPSTEKIALHFNSVTKKFVGRTVDLSVPSASFRPAELKIHSFPTKWHHLECHMGFDQWFPLPQSSSVKPLKRLIMDILGNLSQDIESAQCLIEGEPRDKADLVEGIGEKEEDEETRGTSRRKKGSTSSPRSSPTKKNTLPLEVNLFLPCNKTESGGEVLMIDCCGEVRLVGVLACRVFLHQKATVEEAEKAVKADIIRSLYSRLEMHWDSLIEEEQGCPEDRLTLHEPPRKVFVSLPAWDGKVELLDYIFPGEDAAEFAVMHRSSEEDLLNRGKGNSPLDCSHNVLVNTVRGVLSSGEEQVGSDNRHMTRVANAESNFSLLLVVSVAIAFLAVAAVWISWGDSNKRQ